MLMFTLEIFLAMTTPSLGQQIKEARKRAGLTQAAVADKMSISVQAVSQWETDKTIPNHKNLHDLRNLIGMDIDQNLSASALLQSRHFSWDEPPVAVGAPIVQWRNSDGWSILEVTEDDKDPFPWTPDDFLEIRWKPIGDVFALKVQNNLLSPDFTVGDFIIIDTGRAPERNDVVVVEMADKRVHFGRYIPMGTDEYRAPIFELHHNADIRNSPYKRVDRESPGRVIGVVREQRRYFRMD